MSKKKKTVLEAVDTLSNLADLDIGREEQIAWLDPSKIEENQEEVRDTFRVINTYLRHAYQKEKGSLVESKVQKGLHAMIQLAGEAVEKVDRYTGLFKGAKVEGEEFLEFKKLEKFYRSKVFAKVKKGSLEEAWEKQGKSEARQILKDLETVRTDRDYELFYITYADGAPFFTPHLLKHLRMVGSCDEVAQPVEAQETLFGLYEASMDQALQLSASWIVENCSEALSHFCKEALKHKHHHTFSALTKAVMALFLAASPQTAKAASDYWADFIFYLRQALTSKHHDAPLCLTLMRQLSWGIFLKPEEKKPLPLQMPQATLPLVPFLQEVGKTLTQEVQNYPSGPLMKTLKVFRENRQGRGFDPLTQKNGPRALYTLTTRTLHTTIVHMPAPVQQSTLETGALAPEFSMYLEALGDKTHLYINLQDRTSWKEKLRCTLLEEIERPNFSLVTLAKDSDFYHQLGVHRGVDTAAHFCKALEDEMLGGVDHGFYFPKHQMPIEWLSNVIHFIHTHFFAAKKTLKTAERLDFIEITYFFTLLILVDLEKPDVLNFSCKDGIDVGSTTAALFYAFARQLSSATTWTADDRDCLVYTLFTAALAIRHRSLNAERFNRMLSALSHFESIMQAGRGKILKACAELLPEIERLKLVI